MLLSSSIARNVGRTSRGSAAGIVGEENDGHGSAARSSHVRIKLGPAGLRRHRDQAATQSIQNLLLNLSIVM